MTNECCQPVKKDKPAGFLPGFLYGLLPHTFCLAFVVFSVIGATTATSLFRKFLLVPYFFHLLVLLSFLLATISASIYLKSANCLSREGIKGKWKYLVILYGATIGVNLLLFMVVFPLTANLNNKNILASQNVSWATLKVNIPCSGHASLITDELKKVNGVGEIKFNLPNLFTVSFDPQKVKSGQLLDLEVFKTYKAELQP